MSSFPIFWLIVVPVRAGTQISLETLQPVTLTPSLSLYSVFFLSLFLSLTSLPPHISLGFHFSTILLAFFSILSNSSWVCARAPRFGFLTGTLLGYPLKFSNLPKSKFALKRIPPTRWLFCFRLIYSGCVCDWFLLFRLNDGFVTGVVAGCCCCSGEIVS